MSEGLLFGIGGVFFIMTTWATIAFLLSRFNELHRREVLDSPAVDRIESEGFTEVYVTASDATSEDASLKGPDQPVGGSL